jgi:chromosome segregation ATPase
MTDPNTWPSEAWQRIEELEAKLLTTKKALLVTARERQELEAERDNLSRERGDYKDSMEFWVEAYDRKDRDLDKLREAGLTLADDLDKCRHELANALLEADDEL